MKQNNVKDVIRKQLMKECREFYDIFAEDEKKAIIYPHDMDLCEAKRTYLVNKVDKVVYLLVPLYNDITCEGDWVSYRDSWYDKHEGRFYKDEGIKVKSFNYWREDGNQVVELPEDTYEPFGMMLYKDFFNK